jgi:hypothetical protein
MMQNKVTTTIWVNSQDIRVFIYLCTCQVVSISTLAALVCTPAGSCIVAGGDQGHNQADLRRNPAYRCPKSQLRRSRLWNNIVARAIGQHGLL